MESCTRVSFHSGLVSWMYLHLRFDVQPWTRTQYRSL
ncbi:unnamed protein product [Schistosoma margrebowiei]|uniref:Uncharacterized protein n=1 Tax=Schistosoma margrebowiei TaxID=48269 RepID=A0A183N7L2_9TREM|nr:unnamed protein product [Schistosoma margrebowiei]